LVAIINDVPSFEKGKVGSGLGGGVSVTRLPSGGPPFIVNTKGDPSMLWAESVARPLA